MALHTTTDLNSMPEIVADELVAKLETAPIGILNDRMWMAQGACAGVDSVVFYQNDTPNKYFDPEPAKRICATCPVRMECLWFALANREDFGIWGGTTYEERRLIARQWVTNRQS